MKIFDDATLGKLEALRLAVRRSVRGLTEGDRATGRRGGASEFVSHRAYHPGDDLRQIDWHVYARLGQLFVREQAREERLTLNLVVDASPSMGPKLAQASRVAAGLAAVAFAESARVALWGGNGPRWFDSLGPAVNALDEPMSVPPLRALEALHRTASDRGIVAVLSDFWDEGIREPLLSCARAGEVALLHVLAPEEIAPPPMGRVRLVDSETQAAVERFVGEEEIREYGELLAAHCEDWKKWGHDHGMSYVRFASDASWEQVVTLTLREGGVLE